MKQITHAKLHVYQKQLIALLVQSTGKKFSELTLPGLTSEHMNYHLQKLITLSLVEKKDATYTLTNEGKDYSNLMDDHIEEIEKQPKSSVLLHVIRRQNGVIEHLLSKRKKHPYIGKIGRLTGKIRFGETLEEAAARELFEETGLKAKKYTLERIFHKIRFDEETDDCVQDVIFYVFFISEVYGDFIEETPVQNNIWLPADAMNEDYDFFETLSLTDRTKPKPLHFVEDSGKAVGF